MTEGAYGILAQARPDHSPANISRSRAFEALQEASGICSSCGGISWEIRRIADARAGFANASITAELSLAMISFGYSFGPTVPARTGIYMETALPAGSRRVCDGTTG